MSPTNPNKTTKEIGDLIDPFSPEQKPISQPEKEVLPEVEKQGFGKETKEAIVPQEPVKESPSLKSAQPVEPILAKDPVLIEIENIMEEDLDDTYSKMNPELQQKFNAEGEKTAAKIGELLKETKVQAHKIFKLIFKWLKVIPAVNKFFLKQEAKIKTDKIIKLK